MTAPTIEAPSPETKSPPDYSPDGLAARLDAARALVVGGVPKRQQRDAAIARTKEAADLAEVAGVMAESARALRDNATVSAHIDFGVAPVVLYRTVLEVSRGLFNRAVQRANKVSPLPAIEEHVGATFPTVDEVNAAREALRHARSRRIRGTAEERAAAAAEKAAAVAAAREALDKVQEPILSLARQSAVDARRYVKIAEAARDVRDETGRDLMNGVYGTPLTNAEFYRLCGFSSARAAQIRYGSSGHNPR